jgi:iron complex outermembrane recepter protein
MTPGTRRMIGAAAVLSAGGAFAQGEPPPDPMMEEVVVTGTRIPRPELTSPSPVVSYSRDEITAYAPTVVEEFLNSLPQIAPDLGRTSNNPGDGTASVDLRGLGRGRTLVLLNGRRLAPSSTGSSIDVNSIPGALIERVEIVSGGASAVYGSDAVAGAVNFITRKGFTGIEVDTQADVFGDGDGEVYDVSIAAGMDVAGGRGHVAAFASYLERTAVFQGDRKFTEVVYTDDFEGELVAQGSPTFIPAGRTGGAPPSLTFNPDGTVRPLVLPADSFNFAPANYLQTPLERWSGSVFADYEVGPSMDLYAELSYSRADSSRELAAATGAFFGPFTIAEPFFHPSAIPVMTARFDADGNGTGNALLFRRFSELGSRISADERQNYRGVLGFAASISQTWTLDGFYSYAQNDRTEALDNAASRARVQQGLLFNPATGQCLDPSNGCIPVNIFGEGNLSAAAADFIRITGLANRSSSVQHNAALVATGDVFSWSQGTVKASGGVEFRRNDAFIEADPALGTGDALGFNGFAGAQGAIDVYEAFGELLVPLMEGKRLAERLELELGGRYSDYSTAGRVWTWKAGGQWRPSAGLRIRGMWQRAVRAPNVEELFENLVVNPDGFTLGFVDFCRASADPAGSGLADVCLAQGMDPSQLGVYDPPPDSELVFTLFSGGNPDLRPERADSFTAGFDYTFDAPYRLSIGADYFSIEIEDAIARVGTFEACAVIADPGSDVCQAITRAPDGFPVTIENEPRNIALSRAEGIDVSLDFVADAPAFLRAGSEASIALRTSATWYFDLGSQQTVNSPLIDCAGHFLQYCTAAAASAYPHLLTTTSLSLDTSRWSASARWRYLGGVDNLRPAVDALLGFPAIPYAISHVGGRHYLDLAGQFELFDDVVLRAGVDNVLKTDPPLLASEQSQANTDPSRYDVLGRRFYAGVTVRF